MNSSVVTTICLAALLLAPCGLQAEETGDRRPPREKWALVTIQASIQSIDLEKREVVLQGPEGKVETIEVAEGVTRLDEFKVGDIVTADYWAYAAAEFREPTSAEKAVPLVVLAEGGKAPAGFPPGVMVGAIVRAVVTVERVARLAHEVTVKGPRGKFLTIPIADKKLLKELKKGEVAVVTYAEALAISLVKVSS